MPRTRAYGTARQTEQAAATYARRVKNRLRAEAALQDMSMVQLTARAGLDYGTVMSRLDRGGLRLSDLARMNAVLHMPAATLAELATLAKGEASA